ncbi:hypothetical protein BOTBODRAFT_184433 [Botryobasidium botryosum FD-172 SS1]|uniref:DUF7770 domain-containing protein n=1 Tax=Botryobasidium botryosum (strain FD-172 SS1) TaxID=930990 RepID=A0A067N6L6_BOTB1|nr:hypothetical protein BOTBODRAFT_184433 [Botryobasidium botryosum FD-172 SS1]
MTTQTVFLFASLLLSLKLFDYTMANTSDLIITKHFKRRHHNIQIDELIFNGIPVVPKLSGGEHGGHLIHWRLSAVWRNPQSDSTGSVTYDTVIYPDSVIKIEVISRPYDVSNAAKARFHIAPLQKIAMTDLVTFIEQHGLHRYKYDGKGSGCLHWCTTSIQKLEEEKLISEGSRATFERDHVAVLRENTTWWVPDDHGTFGSERKD